MSVYSTQRIVVRKLQGEHSVDFRTPEPIHQQQPRLQ